MDCSHALLDCGQNNLGEYYMQERLEFLSLGNTFSTASYLLLLTIVFVSTVTPIYLISGLGTFKIKLLSSPQMIRLSILYFIFPGIMEEAIWRWLPLSPQMINHPDDKTYFFILFLSLLATAAHYLVGSIFKFTTVLFHSPAFLMIVFILNLTQGAMYICSLSVWPSILLHWTTLVAWKFLFNGEFLFFKP